MAKYEGPLDVAYRMLENEREGRKDELAVLVGGKYDGYVARCYHVLIDECKGRLQFLYWFNVYRKDGDGYLDNAPGELRRARTEEEIRWI